jgi:hypothetical protein
MQQQEEMNRCMQEQMAELRQLLEETNIVSWRQIEEEPTTITTKTREAGPTISQSLAVAGE